MEIARAIPTPVISRVALIEIQELIGSNSGCLTVNPLNTTDKSEVRVLSVVKISYYKGLRVEVF